MAPLLAFILFQAAACGVLCAVVASEKRRDAFVWGLLGLLLGIFALIAISGLPVAGRPKPAAQRAATTASVISDARQRQRIKEAEKLRRWNDGNSGA
jgi:hypothetical protein